MVLDTTEAARYLRLAPSTLAKLRVRGGGPQYIKVRPRRVVYYEDDLRQWLDAQGKRSSTSDAP